jgi:hypothetical protein
MALFQGFLMCIYRFFICGILLLNVNAPLFSRIVDTFYGPLDLEEPILLDLVDSPAMQRLKDLHQYGVAYYLSHSEEYNRYDHSLGVFALLRIKGASLEEQVSGLLHDVSHTIFSHVGDYIFKHFSEAFSYQDSIHEWFLCKYGVKEILEKHGWTVSEILHKSGRFTALEQDLPELCADRIDYNLQGAYLRGLISKEEVLEIVEDLKFDGQMWTSSKPELLKKMVEFALFMTEDCWGSARNYLTCQWLASAINRAVEIGLISPDEVFFGTDTPIWQRLLHAHDPVIVCEMERVLHSQELFTVVEHSGDLHFKLKFRGIDPWIRGEYGLQRLTELDGELKQKYDAVKLLMQRGWFIKWK